MALTPLASDRLQLQTLPTSAFVQEDKGITNTMVSLAFLKSYEHMGMVQISCVSGCTCSPHLLNCSRDVRYFVAIAG